MEILFFIAAFLSEVIGTVAGFGSSTIFLPLALLFFDFNTALVLVALVHIFGNIGRIHYFKHKLDTHFLLIFGIPSVVLSLIGALLVSYVSQEILKGILGLFLVFYVAIALWKEHLKIKPSLLRSIIGDGISGFFAGLIGTGGALRGAFLTAFGLPKETYIATAAAIALAVDITRIPVYLAEGFLNNRYYWYILPLFVVAISGSYVGKIIVKEIPQKKFTRIVLVALFTIGITFIYDWVRVLI